MGLQEAVEFVARLEAEEMAQLGVGQAAGLVFGEAEPSRARRDTSPASPSRAARSSGMGRVMVMPDDLGGAVPGRKFMRDKGRYHGWDSNFEWHRSSKL